MHKLFIYKITHHAWDRRSCWVSLASWVKAPHPIGIEGRTVPVQYRWPMAGRYVLMACRTVYEYDYRPACPLGYHDLYAIRVHGIPISPQLPRRYCAQNRRDSSFLCTIWSPSRPLPSVPRKRHGRPIPISSIQDDSLYRHGCPKTYRELVEIPAPQQQQTKNQIGV